MMRWVLRRKRWMWAPVVVLAATIGASVAWSANGAEVGSIELQVDEAYLSATQPRVPGAVAGAPVAAPDTMPPDGPRARPGFVSVLVHMDPLFTKGTVQRADVRAFAARQRGVVKYEYDTVMPGVMNLRAIPESRLEELKNLPGVLRVEKDEYHPNALVLHDSSPLIRALQSQITGAGLSADGTGVRVCVVDTGIDSDHIMYSDRIDASAGYDFYNNDNNPEDDHGHGSHVSGIILGGTGVSADFGCGAGSQILQGVAPEATLIGAKVLNSAGGGYDSDIIAGIDHCADQSPSGARADVINMSIGTGNYAGPCTHSWAVAANNAVANGVIAVAASGNENNSNSMGSPACGVDVIAVGMTWKADYPTCEDNITNWNWGICTDFGPQTDEIGCFSNESDYLDVVAPGANIWSASTAAGGSSITGMSGTSMASPQVAGLAALVLDVDPTLTPAEVRQIIRDGAIDMGPAGFDRAYGYGRIDVIDTLNQLTPCTGDPDCDDGLFCNGAETCVAQSCQAGNDPCPGQSCDEGTDQCVAAPTLQYEWTMDTNPGWSTGGLWAWGQPSGGGGQYGGPDPSGGFTGRNAYGYNLNGDYENSLPERHLTTTVIDCTDLAEVSVKFQRWLGVEVSTYDHAYVRVSNNGSTWTTIWQNGAEVAETAWSLQEYDISSVAENQPTVYLRWTLGTTDGSWQYCGWNIDDVQIWARDTGGGCSVPADCDDGLWCNGSEDCVSGSCVAGTPPNCNDGVGCTDDSCNEGTDSCDNAPNDTNCDNGLYCDGAETCHATLDCQSGAAVNCNDSVGCTDDSCNEGTDSCDNVPNDASCDNGQYCDGVETCDALVDCQAGTAVDCDDGVGCTSDSCNESTDSCDNTASDANCVDALFCNGAETCDPVLDCQAGSDPCPGQICDEPTDTCLDCQTNGDCDDGVYCNGAETCTGGTCQGGSPVNCNDGVGCTDDSCNESTDSCDNTAHDSNCDNGLYCDGAETCDSLLDCQSGTAVNCDDGVGCTNDSCNEGTDSCDNVANDANCDNGLYCDGTETCDAVLDCQGGTAVNCDDGVDCTDDSCNETTDSCDNIANDANCDDTFFCNGAETCHATLDCQAGNDPCPGESCDEGADVCISVTCNGNGTCESGEDCSTCPNDCISGGGGTSCGDGVCQPSAGEDCRTCDLDCRGKLNGNPSKQYCCGDDVSCTDSRCNAAPWVCDNTPTNPYCCGDGTCEGVEDSVNCEVDCGPPPVCGDVLCDPGEDECTCPTDCCASAPLTESACSDGCDNDCDGLTDGADPDCACGLKGDPCTVDAECCSFNCRGNGTCK